MICRKITPVILAVPIGLLIGAIVATVGGGGAILALPALVYLLGEPVGPATTASLIVVALGASIGAGMRAREGRLCTRVAIAFSAPAAVGAYLGTLAGNAVEARTLVLAFVPVMLAAAAVTVFRVNRETPVDESRGCPPVSWPQALVAGLVVGVVTGFFGVGGGFLIVPVLTALLGLPMRLAVVTSLAIITLTGLAALASHLLEGASPDWPLTLVLCGSAALGAAIGGALGGRLSATALARGFAVVVSALAIFLLVDVLALGGPPGA